MGCIPKILCQLVTYIFASFVHWTVTITVGMQYLPTYGVQFHQVFYYKATAMDERHAKIYYDYVIDVYIAISNSKAYKLYVCSTCN